MKKRRIAAGLLALVMLMGLLPASALAAGEVDAAELVNITSQCNIVPSSIGSDREISSLYDGDRSTLWAADAGFPGDVTFHLPSPARMVKKVVLQLEEGHTAWGMDVTLFADDVQVDTQTVASFDDGYIYIFPEAQEVTSLKVALSNPKDDGAEGYFWPAIAEAEIWAEPAPNLYEGLVNLAPQATITVPSSQDGRPPENMVDGDLSTLWINNGANWPAEVTFALPGNAKVKRVEIDFEHDSDWPNRAMNVELLSALNGVTSDMSVIHPSARHTMMNTLVYTSDQGTTMSHIRIVLSNPTNTGSDVGSFWPGIAQVKIWAVDETIDLNDYADITEYATETSGGGYKQWDFSGNQQLAGFKVTLAGGATATLKGKLKKDKTWKTYIQTLQSGDNILSYVTGMASVRVELSDPTKLTDFEIWGTYVEPASPDTNNLAFDRDTHSNFNDGSSYLVVDGNTTSGWQADMYPAYLDIDLEANYNLSEITVYTPTTGYTQYTVYTSMDGRDFDLVCDKSKNHDACTADGDVISLSSVKEARIVRVYLEYYSQNTRPILYEVKVKGTPSGTAVQTAPEVTVEAFEDTEYAAPITDQDVYDEVYGIIERQINEKNPNNVDYTQWFTLDLQPKDSNGYDYFTLTDEGGKIKVTGNNGVSLATGINHYLKYFCNVHISQVGNQVNMPSAIVPINGRVHKETKFPVRYAYNYCTHSYTMSFWNEPEWRNELDWQALNGVNVVLDITGQEEVWREFLMSVGYTHQEAKDFLAGPGYYAWAYMANLAGFGGPIHDSFLAQRVELGRKNQRIMRVLGMEPALQAFSGMMPVDINTRNPEADVIPQGNWCGFQRPTMLKTDTTTYDEYAAKFYAAQKRVFGDAKYYATDPFHEGGNTGGMSGTAVASALLDSLLDFDSDAVWIIQCWQENPSNALLAGLGNRRADHALVLDLWAEHTEFWKGHSGKYESPDVVEFSDTPWVWCMLNNFGGRMGLHGHLDAMQQNIPAAANSAQHMAGIGMSPEGAQENPVLYDFLFETIWAGDASQPLEEIELDQWLKDYVRRRYGAQSDSAEAAMAILADTVYKSSLNMSGQGAPESPINGRPSLEGGKASEWGNGTIAYSKIKLEEAARLLLEDYDTLSASNAYLYDVADVLKQHLSNYADNAQKALAAAYRAGDAAAFDQAAEEFLSLINVVEQVLGTRSEFTFGKWTGGAEFMAQNTDDFTQRLYLRNAKALVTTWGSKEQNSGLRDYSNRQWAGLTNDYYKARWEQWIDAAKTQLAANSTTESGPSFDWFPWEWEYARDQKPYSSAPNGLDIKALGEQVLTDYSVRDPLGEREIDPSTMSIKTGTEENSDEDGAAANVLDRDTSSIWHSNYSGTAPTAADKWIALDLGEAKQVDGLRYLPRQGGGTNGIVTGYKVLVSCDESDWNGTTDGWTEAASGTWANDREWKETTFAAREARYVKFLVTAGVGGFATAAELRVLEVAPEEYSITYDLAGGTVAKANPASYTAKTATFTLNNPTKAGHTFAGWTGTGLTGATMTVTIAQGSTGDRAYTATWTKNSEPEPTEPTKPSGTATSTTTTTEVTQEGETVTTVVNEQTGETKVTVVAPNGSEAKIVTKGGKTEAAVTVSQEALENAGDGAVELPMAGVTVENKPVVNVTLPETSGEVLVSIRAEELSAGTVAVRVLPDGTEEIVPVSLVEDGKLYVSMEGSGSIRLIDNDREFDDVGEKAWYAESVAYTSSRELLRGTGLRTFSPDMTLSRGMLATVLYRYAGEPDVGTVSFDDVADGYYYSDAVRWAAEQKVVSGVGGGSFAPDRKITREELAVMLYRFAGSPELEEGELSGFADGAAVSGWAEKAMCWAVAQGILRGTTGGNLRPQANASRAEAAVMLYRFTRAKLGVN